MPDRFRLRQLLDHQRRLEEQKAVELATLAAEESRTRAVLQQLREQEEAQLRSLTASRRSGTVEPRRLDAALTYLRGIEERIANHLDHVASVERKVLESREALIEILRAKQLLERLEERHDVAEADDERRREATAADEFTAQRFARRRHETPETS